MSEAFAKAVATAEEQVMNDADDDVDVHASGQDTEAGVSSDLQLESNDIVDDAAVGSTESPSTDNMEQAASDRVESSEKQDAVDNQAPDVTEIEHPPRTKLDDTETS